METNQVSLITNSNSKEDDSASSEQYIIERLIEISRTMRRSITRNAQGLVTEVEDLKGRKCSFTWDDNNQLVEVNDFDGSKMSRHTDGSIARYYNGTLSSYGGNWDELSVDEHGCMTGLCRHLALTECPSGARIQQLPERDWYRQSSKPIYDRAGRLAEVFGSDGRVIRGFCYDSEGVFGIEDGDGTSWVRTTKKWYFYHANGASLCRPRADVRVSSGGNLVYRDSDHRGELAVVETIDGLKIEIPLASLSALGITACKLFPAPTR